VSEPTELWRPGPQRIAAANISRYQQWLADQHGLQFESYEDLWHWSVSELEAFWASLWDFFDIKAHSPYEQVLARRDMPHAQWFTGATLNYAEHLLARAGEADAGTRPALIFESETSGSQQVSWQDLNHQTGALMGLLRSFGVSTSDRIASYMPNIPHTVSAMLATTGVGATWSSCSPDMGAAGVLDRFRQIEPVGLFAVDGYRYGGKDFDRRDQVREMVRQLPSLRFVVFVPYLNPQSDIEFESATTVRWHEAIADGAEPAFEAVAFDHPLWIVYSSGTTGMPKPIVHGHGGSLIESLKANALHLDLNRDDRFFWFTSTSWIMWNLWVSTLATGCTALHYDGNPAHPDLDTLWRFASKNKASFFGTSPAYINLNQKAGTSPRQSFDLTSIRTVGSTGSPLTEEQYEWVYEHIGRDLLLASISGGTDPGAAFLTALPTLPVYAGYMQCRSLGCAVSAFNDDGQPVIGDVGELVVTEPMPSMPLYFLGDTDGSRYFNSYFDPWPHAWRHGDWLALHPMPESVTSIVYGRSDSTINRHGIRMGSSELYRVVESFDWVMDSIVVDLEFLGKPSQLLLFVVVRDGEPLSDAMQAQVNAAIRTQLSARHVPDVIESITEVPRTMSGKKLEVPVKRILLGHDPATVLNRDSMLNPDSIDFFIDYR